MLITLIVTATGDSLIKKLA